MKKHRVFHLFILIFCGYLISTRSTHQVFEFTESLYNLSLEENSIGSKYARADNATKIGVPLPEKDASCKFRIAEIVGDRSSIFKAHSRLVGNFVFLRVRYKGDNPLNRELKDFYDILVKANCKRRDLTNLETATRIHLRVIDRNDASPVFLVDERGYNVDIKDDVAPFSNILRVEASDADVGLNSEIYFSLPNRSRDFFVEPLSGCIRTLRHIKAGEYHFKVKAEDRTSRLLYFDENEVQPSWTADVKIRVQATTPKKILFNVTHRKINLHLISARQEVAAITIENSYERASVGLKEIETKWFEIEREEPNRWILYMKKGAKVTQRTNITLTIGEDYKMFFPDENSPVVSNLTVIVPIEFISERSIRLIDADLTPVIIIDRMVPINLIVKRVRAELSNPDDVPLLRYRIQYEPNKTIPFAIGAKNGILRVSSKPGYERQFNFSVVAYLHGVSTVISSKPMSVSVLILDGNLHAPIWPAKWMRQEPIAIKSGQKSNEVILKVEASDQDEGDNGHVVYKITAESDNLPINIDAKTGEIYISEWFADTASTYWPVTVWAMDLGTPMSRMSMLNLVFYKNGSNIPAKPKPVIVSESANLYAPQFTSFPDVVEISEDAPVGTILTQLVAVDKDFGYNGRIRYLIHDIKDFSEEILNIDINNGVVSIASDLSLLMRENMETMDLDVQISATDAGTPPKSCSKTLKLRVIDVNNHSPQFEEPMYYTRINEFEDVGKFVAKVSATDFDGGKNGQVRYYLAKNDNELLNIDETTGNITLARKLDREEHNIYTSIVIATDNGNPAKLAFTNFTVIVEDANDNAPKCVNLISRVQIPEDLPHGAFVTCISALDLDSGLNSKLKYSVINETLLNIPFRIDHHSGCLFIHAPEVPLDFQKIPYYNISVDVADHGTPVLSTTCYLNIDIVNVITSNFAIEFDDVAKEASVYENSEIGSEVIMIEAKELTDGRQRRKGIEYDIIGGDGWGFFSIDNTGTVRTSSLLDREFRSSYWITVEAKFLADEVNLRRSVSARRRSILHVFIRILDRNDHRPIPKKPMYFADVPENSIANVVIAKIEATDADDVENDGASPLTYKIERGDPQSFFRIDVTSGYITTSGVRRLDREKQAEHELWVVICDGGEPSLCSNVVVLVKVTDENDNAPTFTQAVYHYNVRPMFVGQICRIFAVDADSGLNADLYYNITEGDPRFSIDENGNIATSEIIHADESYALTVQATDCGINSQFSATRVILTASGNTNVSKKPSTNNSVPTISGKKSDYVIPISDADQVGLTVGKLEAIDEDGDDLWWEIISGNVKSVFDIRKDNGQLLLAKKVENLERGEIKLNISVTDGIYSDYTIVTIQVSRQITQRPRFSASHYQTDVSERTAIGTQIYTLKATGETSGPGSKPLVYSLFSIDDVAMEDKIRVEPSSGNVVIMEPLDFEKSRHFHAIVQVQHAGLRSFATFLVNINDENDNAPFFVEKTRSLFVDESDMGQPSRQSLMPAMIIVSVVDENDESPSFTNNTVKSRIIQPSADGVHIAMQTALDKDTVGRLRYFFKDNLTDQMFAVDSRSGEITVKNSTILASTMIEVFVTDGLHQSSYRLDVEVLPVNNLSTEFKFSRAEYEGTIMENTTYSPDHVILKVSTKGPKAHIPVLFSNISPSLEFFVHPLTGVISATGIPIDREKNSIICFVVTAKTIETTPQVAQSLVTIRVKDFNDEMPKFTNIPYDVSVHADAEIGSKLLTITAEDNDEGDNRKIRYISENIPDLLTLEGADVVLKRKLSIPVDLNFSIVAQDLGNPMRSSVEFVNIRVVDKNQPIFEQNVYTSIIAKNQNKNAVLAKVTARSNPKMGSRRGKIGYEIVDSDGNFSLNFDTGEVRATTDLPASDVIEIEAFEVTRPKLRARTTLTIIAHEELAPVPVFQQSNYTVTIPESMPVGHLLMTIQAELPDIKDRVVYSMLSSDDSSNFVINPDTGEIVILKPLDYETQEKYEMNIIATSQTNSQAIVPLVVIIDDVNDEVPFFLKSKVSAFIDDASIPGQLITIMSATDLDTVSSIEEGNGKQKLFFEIVEGDESLFNITNDAGIVTLARSIESFDLSEDNTRKTLNVSVTDGIFTAYAQLCIEFLRNGAMQEPPRFRQNNYVVSALENTVINGSTLLIVSVKGGIAPLRFSLGSGSSDIHVSKWKWPVSIDTQTGRVHLSRVLNYHRDKRYEIPLVVEDANKRRAFSMLTLSVIDVNDKPPVFVLPFYSTSVSESAKEGDTVLMVSAIDDDENDEIEYSLIDDSETTFFKVHPRQGTVTVARQLEHKAGTILSLTIKATDSANPPHHATTSLEINVVSEAFKVPVFSNSHYLFSVLEDAAVGNVIGRVQQMEAEIDEVRFNIVEPVTNFPFSVERSTGKIVVKSALDKENRERWKMAIRADAAGGVHTIATVTIDVIDVNDNAPEFQGFYEQLTVSEDAAIGTSVTIFSAMDKDDSPSGKILFSLVEDSKNFQIDENSGWLTVASTLDREENAQYKLIVRATDEGGFNTELPISVVVTDVNDSPPRFEKSQFLVDLNSSAAISDLVFRFKVNDDDLAPNNISQLFITSGNEEGVFVVDTDYGLRLNRPKLLDNQRYYNLTVLAFDGRFHATSNIIIKIISIDTSIRCTTKTYTTSIAERSKKGSVILEESILSSYPNISFELKAAREVPMVMNYRNGIIKVTGNIDYEKTPNFELTRLTMQNGNIVCEEDINIIVLNENDNHPKINQKDDFVSIEENLPTTEDERQYVTRILATDADGDRIKYRIVDSYNDTFRIDENNGVVTAIKALDSEKVSKYKLTVIVSDGKFEDKATIHVIVVDKNDNAPKFEKDSYSMKVMESESIDYKLLQVQASGGDANETIEYTIQPSLSSHYFKLNSHTGELSLAKRLDFETLKRLQIRIVATDSGSPPLSSDASIEIIVMDENDNSPIFEKQSYDANIKENAKFGTRVITLKAMDVDSEHFGSVSYEIKAAENNQEPIPFSINDNGEVRTTGQIDYEKINKYSLKITAKDGGTPPRMSEVICNVHIEDENDNTPMFEDCNMTVVAQEGSQIGRALFRFVVTDLDGPANGGPFKLSIIGDSSQFFRVTNDLQLVTVKSLQHAKRDKLLLTAIAKDVKGRATECPLTIYIRKESRHAPTMKPMIIRLNTLFNEMQAGVIGKVKATDEDDGDVLKFGIVDGSIIAPMPTLEYPNQPSISEKPHFFRIDTISGQVWADHSISPGLHSFNVTVSDGKFTTVSYVEVHVSSIDNDIIDHAVSIRIRAMSVDEFLHNHVDNFRRIISHNLNLHENSIQLVSVQAAKYDDYQRTKRDVPSDVEILLTAQRGHGRGYLKPDHVYSRLKSDFQNLNAQKGLLNFKLTTEMCTTGACLRGECREMIDMIEDEWTYFSTDTFSFVAPFHVRRAKCLCPDGFGGKRCESEMNECSKSPCEHWQICVPSRNETFECICPLGMTGELCAKPSCKDNGKCLEGKLSSFITLLNWAQNISGPENLSGCGLGFSV
uniref:Uncharacterized protein n=1 Tax=Caenorhabditis japonica TaxID=281687 RepID=A0A8R1DPU5_CAEJA